MVIWGHMALMWRHCNEIVREHYFYLPVSCSLSGGLMHAFTITKSHGRVSLNSYELSSQLLCHHNILNNIKLSMAFNILENTRMVYDLMQTLLLLYVLHFNFHSVQNISNSLNAHTLWWTYWLVGQNVISPGVVLACRRYYYCAVLPDNFTCHPFIWNGVTLTPCSIR